MTEFPDHPFWDYSLKVYMSDGVGAACLALQEAHQLDVNVVLFCVWLGASGRGALTDSEMSETTRAVGTWHDSVVRPLRAVRVRMKGGMPPSPDDLADSLRRRIQKIEIDCEHTEQLMLAAAVERKAAASRGTEAADAAANIGCYFRALGIAVSDEDRDHLGVVLRAAFPESPSGEIDALRAGL